MSSPQSSLESLRQLSAFLLAQAVLDLFPSATLVEGGVTDIGFYYDFLFKDPVDESILSPLEERMHALWYAKPSVKNLEMMRTNAVAFFQHHGQKVKADLVKAGPDPLVTVCQMGEFFDVCPVKVPESWQSFAFKLYGLGRTTLAIPIHGTASVVRLKGTAFPDDMSLKAFLKTMEQAKKRDHRRLGKEFDLFDTNDDTGAGFWVWYPHGATIREQLLDWWRIEHRRGGFLPVVTPRVVKASFLRNTGWYDIPGAREKTLPTFSLDGQEYVATPTTSPLHAAVFRTRFHSYRELPLRYAECGNLYEHGKSNALHGMLKARAYLSDDATIFCTPEQLKNELISSLHFIVRTVRIFGFQHRLTLSARRDRFKGTLGSWGESADRMVEALQEGGFAYDIEESREAMNGPRVDVRYKDALGREWTGPSVALDLNLPERFGLRYQGADDEMHVPLMVTRSMFGSVERFVAILVEHFGGEFPLWLAPEQVRILPLAPEQGDKASEVCKTLEVAGFRVSLDGRKESLSHRVRMAEKANVPYVVVLGKEEVEKGVLSVRRCKVDGNLVTMQEVAFLEILRRESGEKSLG